MRKLLISCSIALALALALAAAPARAVVTGTTTEVTYTGNASTTAFPFSFKATDKTWVKVSLGGVEQASGFTVTLNTNQDTAPGGTVTFTAAPTSGVPVELRRKIPLEQTLVLKDGERFPAKAVERGLDRAVLIAQEVDRRVAEEEAARASDSAVQSGRDSGQDAKQASDLAAVRSEVASAAMGGGVHIGDTSTVLATGSTTARTLAEHLADEANPINEGAARDGVADDAGEIQAALNKLAANRTVVVIPAGRYRLASQVTLTAPSDRRVIVWAYGAEFITDGAISGLKITGGGPNGGATVYGLTINHRGNATATYGLDFIRTWRAKCVDCNVVAHGVSASYAAAHIANETPANNDTGSFWTTLQDFSVRKFAGADPGEITHGVLIEGAGNATRLIGGTISDVVVGVKVQAHVGQSYVAAATVIDGVAFEGYSTAFEAPSNVSGVRFVNNRLEDGTTVFSVLSGGGNPNVPAFLAGNYMVSNAGAYLLNPDGVVVNSLDMSTTPSIIGSGTKTRAHWIMEAPNGSTDVLTLKALGGGRGLQLKKSDDTSIGGITWTGTGDEVEFKASQPSGSQLLVTGIKGLSGSTSVRAHNLRGLATFAGAATKAVVFPNAETDADYRVTLGPGISGSFWVTDKTTAGFTINAEVAKTGPVDWMLVR
jgi:hypothetical protein